MRRGPHFVQLRPGVPHYAGGRANRFFLPRLLLLVLAILLTQLPLLTCSATGPGASRAASSSRAFLGPSPWRRLPPCQPPRRSPGGGGGRPPPSAPLGPHTRQSLLLPCVSSTRPATHRLADANERSAALPPLTVPVSSSAPRHSDEEEEEEEEEDKEDLWGLLLPTRRLGGKHHRHHDHDKASSLPLPQPPQPPQPLSESAARPLFQRAVALLRGRLGQQQQAGRVESVAMSVEGGGSMVWTDGQTEEDGGEEEGAEEEEEEEEEAQELMWEEDDPQQQEGEGGSTFQLLPTSTTTTSSGGGTASVAMYDWLTGLGWLVVRLRHRGFSVGLLFVKLRQLPPPMTTTMRPTTMEDDEEEGARSRARAKAERSGRQAVRAVGRRLTSWLMETRAMRGRYSDWARRTSNTKAAALQAPDTPDGDKLMLLPPRPRAQGEEPVERSDIRQLRKVVAAVVVSEGGDGGGGGGFKVDPMVQGPWSGRPLSGVIWRLALPLMGSLALDPVMSLFDTFYVGSFMGPACLSALGVADRVVCAACYVVTFVLSTPTTPLVARLRGEGRNALAHAVVRRLCLGAALTGAALVPVLFWTCVPLVRVLGACDHNMVNAVAYFRMRSLGAPAILLNAVAAGALRGWLDSSTPLLIALAAFFLDYTLQPHWLPHRFIVAGPQSLGGFGATTVLAEYLAATLFTIKLWQLRPRDGESSWRRAPKGLTSALMQAMFQGLSVFTRLLLYQLLLVCATFAVVARAAGPVDLAAHQVAIQLYLLPSVVFDGLAVAGQGLVGDCVGRQRISRARKVARMLLVYGAGLGAALGLGFAALGRLTPVLQVFSRDPVILAKVRLVTGWFFPVLMPLTGFVQVGAGVLQGASDFHFQAKMMAVCVLLTCGPLTLLGSGRTSWGLGGVWLSLLLFQGLRAVGLCWRFWVDPSFALSTTRPQLPSSSSSSGSGQLSRRRRPWWRRVAAVSLVLRVLTGRAEASEEEQEQAEREQRKRAVEEMWLF